MSTAQRAVRALEQEQVRAQGSAQALAPEYESQEQVQERALSCWQQDESGMKAAECKEAPLSGTLSTMA